MMRIIDARCGIAALAAVVALAVASPSIAQSSTQCREQGSDAERIACLEARIDALEAALAAQEGEQGAAAAVEAPVAASAPEPVVDLADSFGAEQIAPVSAAAATETVTETATAASEPRARRRWLRMPSIPFLGEDDDDSGSPAETAVAASEPAATSVAAAPDEPAASTITDPESFGSEQVVVRNNRADEQRAEDDEEVLRAQIIDFQELHRGRLVVALDNGQMWRQMDVDTRQVRLEQGETYPVEIRRSGFGGYRMKIADSNRIFQVERLR